MMFIYLCSLLYRLHEKQLPRWHYRRKPRTNDSNCQVFSEFADRLISDSQSEQSFEKNFSKVEEQIKAMETAQAEKLNELEERKARKNKIKTTLKECKKSNIIYPQIITDLTQNNLSLEKKRELISLAADQILARLRIDKMRHLAKPPPLDAKIETMDDLLKFC